MIEKESSSTSEARHRIIFADRQSITPNDNDVRIKKQWMEIYNENLIEGAVKSDGTIVWDCPCLGTQAIGPCSMEFRDAFSCYQKSLLTPKGSECIETFKTMHKCFSRYPKLYGKNDEKRETSRSNKNQMQHPEARRQRLKQQKEEGGIQNS